MRIASAGKRHGEADEIELFTAVSGAVSARIRRNGGFLHLHSAVNPEAEASYCTPPALWADLVVLLGSGLGYHLDPSLCGLGEHAEILLIDRYAPCVEACRKRMQSTIPNRIHAVSGETDGWPRIVAEAVRPARTIQVIRHPASYRANKDFYDMVARALNIRKVNESGTGGGLLFYGSFFLEEELKNALRRTEGGVSLFEYGAMKDCAQLEAHLERAVQEFRPAFILSVNMKGFDANGAVPEIARRYGVPLVIWFVDDPHPILIPQAAFVNGSMVALSWERAYLPWLDRKGFGATGYLPLAGDPDLFAGADTHAFAGVGFVGSAMGQGYRGTIASQFLWNDALGGIADSAARKLLEDRSLKASDAIRSACEGLQTTLPFSDGKNLTWFTSYCIHTASMLRRRELIGACIPHGVATFGDIEGWRELFGARITCHGDIDYRTRLGSIYRGIAVNLNITSRQMPTAVNQRTFDIPLSNGFVLSDRQGDCEELFSPDETALYGSKEELIDKLVYFRTHKEAADRITRKARARILSCHTYDHRIAAIKSFIAKLSAA